MYSFASIFERILFADSQIFDASCCLFILLYPTFLSFLTVISQNHFQCGILHTKIIAEYPSNNLDSFECLTYIAHSVQETTVLSCLILSPLAAMRHLREYVKAQRFLHQESHYIDVSIRRKYIPCCSGLPKR